MRNTLAYLSRSECQQKIIKLTTLTKELDKMSKRSSLLAPGKFLVLDIHDVALVLIDQRHLVNK